MNNQELKRELVNKILLLTKIQQNEVLNIIKKEKINYSSNNNGIFINLTKIDMELINKINLYINYLKNNQENLNKIEVNVEKINEDLNKNWVVISEAIQVILKREGITDGYELLKDFTRKYETLTKREFDHFIDNLDISYDYKMKEKN